MNDDDGRNFPEQFDLPAEVKRKARRRQANTNEKLKEIAKRAGKGNFKNQKHVDIMAFNASAEEKFVEIVRKLIEESGRTAIPIGTVCQETAYGLNISTQTAKRYLVKHSARQAALRVFGKDVMLNPRYEPEEEADET